MDTKICATCNKPIEGGQALTALEKHYHPEHFVCCECKQVITDKQFQQHEGKNYCTFCYTKHFLQKCHKCFQPITGKCIKALGETWHEEHFICSGCKTGLAGKKFMEARANPFCEKCYCQMFAEKCRSCGKAVTDNCLIAIDKKWHHECFKCYKCGKKIVDNSYQTQNGQPVCIKC